MIRRMRYFSVLRGIGVLCLWLLGGIMGLKADNAEAWLVDEESGVSIWNPLPVTGESVHWRGLRRDSASGSGLVIWKLNGSESEQAAGDWESGRLHGDAVWQHSDGQRYEGQWESGRRHGFGVYTWQDGTRYCGVYHEGVRQAGAVFNPDGSVAGGGLLTVSIRKQVLDAERAALQARKNATKVRQQYLR